MRGVLGEQALSAATGGGTADERAAWSRADGEAGAMAGVKAVVANPVQARCENCGKQQTVDRDKLALSSCDHCGKCGFAVKPPAGQGQFRF